MQFINTAEMSLSDATMPLLVASRLVGVNPKSQCHKIYTGLMMICDLALVCHIWRFYTSGNFRNYYFQILVYILRDFCFVISIFVILGLTLLDRNRFMVPLRDLTKIDESLKSLGARIDNRSTYRLEILQVIFIGYIPISFWVTEFKLYIFRSYEYTEIILMRLCHYLANLIVCSIVDCSFLSILFIIKRRFKEINSIIRSLGTPELHSRVHSLEVSRAHADNDVFRAVEILRKGYHDLWQIANQVNDDYGLHLLVSMITALALITHKLYEAYSTYVTSDTSIFYATVGSINWVLFYVMRILVLAQACESTVAEAKATSVTLQKLRMKGNHSPATKEEIRDFFTQLLFEVKNFTAYGFFDINFPLVCGILGAACTYLIILIQMSDSSSYVVAGYSNESIHFEADNHL